MKLIRLFNAASEVQMLRTRIPTATHIAWDICETAWPREFSEAEALDRVPARCTHFFDTEQGVRWFFNGDVEVTLDHGIVTLEMYDADTWAMPPVSLRFVQHSDLTEYGVLAHEMRVAAQKGMTA